MRHKEDPHFSVPKHRTAKGALRVEQLINAAAELFLERGFDGVAVDDLIARVGGSRGNVYTHFGGKEGLFKEAMLHVCKEISKPLEVLRIEGRDAADVLPSFGRALVQAALSPRVLAVHKLLTVEGQNFPEVAQAMLSVSYQKVVDLLTDWVAKQQATSDGRLSRDLPAHVLAEQFVSMVTSDVKLRVIVGWVKLPLPEEQVEALVSRAVHTFLHGADRSGQGKTK
ncbi:TetR family transcriptional regulator [Xanthomonas citri pv. malvacearum str. GSPB2388]|uniref:TetR/AcrR family transcriptional regulator n=1 Tax=Xanthomonas citri TaxID=346 RepID=UPI0002985E83|nr:TetR/AcrR family transcriptional regulator [Xanthomonas citri]EKQ62714.1 TetR family transcriptional regulator [Xanthomonas citri pv. malvacearum str. GSPB2388]